MKVLFPALHESARGTEQPSAAVRFEVGCRKLTRPSADIVATPADNPTRTILSPNARASQSWSLTPPV